MSTRTRTVRLTLGLTLLAPAGVIAGTVGLSGVAHAATGTTCSSDTGAAKLKPGISNTPAVQTATLKGKLGGCSGTVTSGVLTGKLKGTSKSSCATLSKPSVSKGSLTITWNTKAKSVIPVTVNTSPTGSSTVTGKVKSGLFAGDTLSSTLMTTGTTGNCNPMPITQETYSGTFSLS